MAKLLVVEVVISGLYVFDASTSPLLHIPLLYLTLLYFASMLEMIGLFRLQGYLRRRLGRSTRAEALGQWMRIQILSLLNSVRLILGPLASTW